MNDNIKTLVFVGLAVIVGAAAFFTRPRGIEEINSDRLIGQELIKSFDPLAAASVEIVEFDEANAALKPFTVERKKVKDDKVRWVIPSHHNYPTDAQNQLTDVATALNNRKILDVVSDSPGDYSEYGVVDPRSKDLKVGSKGVGKRVEIRDDAGKALVSLIIGKALPDKSELRYVRQVDGDSVCVVELASDKISADFEKWIEKDLLKLNGWDLKQVRIDDHSVDFNEGALIQRRRMTLDYNDTGEQKWKLARDSEYVPGSMLSRGKWKDATLGEDEELDTAKLDALKNALDDLKIVDVQPKPAGLSTDLKASGDVQKMDASLQRRGFGIGDAGEGPQVYSSEGETRAVTKDGVEYVLRFGNDTGEESKKEENKDGKADEKSPGKNRYLLVMAQFNQDAIERPKLEEAGETEKKPEGDKPADAPKTDEAPKPDAPEMKPEGDKPADAAKGDPGPKGDEAKPEPKADEEMANEKKDEPKQEEPAAEKKEEKKLDAAQIEQIQKENKRKLDEYDEKVKKGKERVKELNDRFADWYYVISNSEFEKIHFSRDQIVKAKDKKEDKKEGEDHEGHDHEAHDATKSDLEKFDEMKSVGPGGK